MRTKHSFVQYTRYLTVAQRCLGRNWGFYSKPTQTSHRSWSPPWKTEPKRLCGRWRPPLPPMRSTGGQRCGGLSYCLIKVAFEAPFFVANMWHLVHGEAGGGEYHEGRIGRLAIGGSCLYTVEGLAWCSGFRISSMQVGAATRWILESYLSG
jgi:hypothetical protein